MQDRLTSNSLISFPTGSKRGQSIAKEAVAGEAMDLKDLRYFRAVAESGSFSKAAAHIRVAQPALSRHMSRLEHSLGVELLRRTSKGVILTPAGAELLKRTAAEYPGVVKEPLPQVYVVNFSAGAVTFQLRAWTDRHENWAQLRSDLSVAVKDALAREEIAIA